MTTEAVTIRISGMAAEVSREMYRCAKCGHEQRTIDQRDSAERAAIEHIRATNSLLAPREIRKLRESLSLTISDFAELIYGTPKGIVEGWEKGRYVQNREADELIRSLSNREVLELRALKAGVTLPVLEGVASPTGPDSAPPD